MRQLTLLTQGLGPIPCFSPKGLENQRPYKRAPLTGYAWSPLKTSTSAVIHAFIHAVYYYYTTLPIELLDYQKSLHDFGY